MTLQIKGLGSLLLFAGILLNSAFALENRALIPVYKTNAPLAQLGFDVSENQTVAVRFSPPDDVTLESIELWFMNNSSMEQGVVTVTLRDDKKNGKDQSVPGKEVLESWTFPISSLGWNIAQEILISVNAPELKHNKRYWVVAESTAPALSNPVWSIAGYEGGNISLGYGGSYNPKVEEWTSVGYSAIPNVHIVGTLPRNP